MQKNFAYISVFDTPSTREKITPNNVASNLKDTQTFQ